MAQLIDEKDKSNRVYNKTNELKDTEYKDMDKKNRKKGKKVQFKTNNYNDVTNKCDDNDSEPSITQFDKIKSPFDKNEDADNSLADDNEGKATTITKKKKSFE